MVSGLGCSLGIARYAEPGVACTVGNGSPFPGSSPKKPPRWSLNRSCSMKSRTPWRGTQPGTGQRGNESLGTLGTWVGGLSDGSSPGTVLRGSASVRRDMKPYGFADPAMRSLAGSARERTIQRTASRGIASRERRGCRLSHGVRAIRVFEPSQRSWEGRGTRQR